MSDKTTAAIISELEKSLPTKGLRIVKLDEPITSSYSEEWEIQDNCGWIYARLGICDGIYKYAVFKDLLFSTESQSLFDFVKSAITQAHSLTLVEQIYVCSQF